MKIYKPYLKSYYLEDLENLKTGKDILLEISNLGYFSSLEKSLEHLKELIKENLDDNVGLASIVVEEIELDSYNSKINFYDKQLNYLGFFDYEQVYENPKYNKHDWVLFIEGDKLLCGKIAEVGGNEPYLIIYEDCVLTDCSPHSHCSELNIVKTISEKEAEKLLPAKYFQTIKNRVGK